MGKTDEGRVGDAKDGKGVQFIFTQSLQKTESGNRLALMKTPKVGVSSSRYNTF